MLTPSVPLSWPNSASVGSTPARKAASKRTRSSVEPLSNSRSAVLFASMGSEAVRSVRIPHAPSARGSEELPRVNGALPGNPASSCDPGEVAAVYSGSTTSPPAVRDCSFDRGAPLSTLSTRASHWSSVAGGNSPARVGSASVATNTSTKTSHRTGVAAGYRTATQGSKWPVYGGGPEGVAGAGSLGGPGTASALLGTITLRLGRI